MTTTASSTATFWSCLMCPREVPSAVSCCSTGCVLAANRELQHNLRALRRLDAPAGDDPGLRHLAERTGHLSSAVLRRAVHGRSPGPAGIPHRHRRDTSIDARPPRVTAPTHVTPPPA